MSSRASFAGAEIHGLTELKRQLKELDSGLARELTKAIKLAGKPVLSYARTLAPVGPAGQSTYPAGSLRAGYKLAARQGSKRTGPYGELYNRVPYAGGAEWGQHGKWSGFRRYYGPEGGKGRFAWRAVLERRRQISYAMLDGLERLEAQAGMR